MTTTRLHWLLVAMPLAFVAAASSLGAANLGPTACLDGLETSKSTFTGANPLTVYCGPASAVVKSGGREYRFRKGTCTTFLGGFRLDLGKKIGGVPIFKKQPGHLHLSTLKSRPTKVNLVMFAGTKSWGASGKITRSASGGKFTGTAVYREGSKVVNNALPISGTFRCKG